MYKRQPIPQMGNVEVRKNKEGYELNLNALIYSELLMSNVRFLVTNQICRVLPVSYTHLETFDDGQFLVAIGVEEREIVFVRTVRLDEVALSLLLSNCLLYTSRCV